MTRFFLRWNFWKAVWVMVYSFVKTEYSKESFTSVSISPSLNVLNSIWIIVFSLQSYWSSESFTSVSPLPHYRVIFHVKCPAYGPVWVYPSGLPAEGGGGGRGGGAGRENVLKKSKATAFFGTSAGVSPASPQGNGEQYLAQTWDRYLRGRVDRFFVETWVNAPALRPY